MRGLLLGGFALLFPSPDVWEFPQSEEPVPRSRGVLEARQRGLRSQGLLFDGVPVEEHLADRIVSQAGGVVRVGVAAGDGVDPLGEKLGKLVLDLAALPIIAKATGEAFEQSQPSVGCLQENRFSVAAAVVFVEEGDDGIVEEFSKDQTLCMTLLVDVKASRVAESGVATASYHRGAFSCSGFVNDPG